MNILKTKDAAELLSVSQTTIKRWAAMLPDLFPKDRFGHYSFTEQQVHLLRSIKDRIDNGETLESIQIAYSNKNTQSLQQLYPQLLEEDEAMLDIFSRIHSIELALDQKADEIVMVQLFQQRQELEDLRTMIKQIAVTLESKSSSYVQSVTPDIDSETVMLSRRMNPPKKRGLIRSFFFL